MGIEELEKQPLYDESNENTKIKMILLEHEKDIKNNGNGVAANTKCYRALQVEVDQMGKDLSENNILTNLAITELKEIKLDSKISNQKFLEDNKEDNKKLRRWLMVAIVGSVILRALGIGV